MTQLVIAGRQPYAQSLQFRGISEKAHINPRRQRPMLVSWRLAHARLAR